MARKAAAALTAIILGTLTAACSEVTADNGEPGGRTASQPAAAGGSGSGLAPGSFPRSFLIPGTDTSISIGGFVGATGSSRFGQ